MTSLHKFGSLFLFLFLASVAWCSSASADVTIRVDYSTDTSNFFNPNTTNGALARAAMNAAAAFYSDILEDELSAIAMPFNPAAGQPGKFYGELGGEATWYFQRKFSHPATGVTNAVLNSTFAEDEYVVFVGARALTGGELGRGGAGAWATSFARNGQFTTDERNQITSMNEDFQTAVARRGQASGFGSWGGSIAFNSNATWHFNHNTVPGAGASDFFSVALHELAHTLGFGGVEQWSDLTSGTTFTGSNARTAYGQSSNVPLESADDLAHWLQGISDSNLYGGGEAQKPLMVPNLANGIRRRLTNLDAAALVDLGWQIDLPSTSALTAFSLTSASGGNVAGAALSLSIVPEPTSGLMFVGGLLTLACTSRRRSVHG